MKKNDKKALTIISILLIVIIIANTLSPLCSYAAEDDADSDFGGRLFKPISKLVCAIGDGVIMGLQYMFLGYGDITDTVKTGEEGYGAKSTDYKILYGPRTIFSNKVPALNANFINPTESKYKAQAERTQGLNSIGESNECTQYCNYDIEDTLEMYNDAMEKAFEAAISDSNLNINDTGYYESSPTMLDSEKTGSLLDSFNNPLFTRNETVYTWEYNEKTYYMGVRSTSSYDNIQYKTYYTCKIFLYEANIAIEEGNEIEYSASVLRKIISKWYRGLRTIALVGLLSVLVYVGIRIIISSTGRERSKYKKMIGDWFAAICILFVLQYIMAFTITITDELLGIFPQSTEISNQELTEEDELMSRLRTEVADKDDMFNEVFAQTIMYVALVVLTCIFTIHYLKRFIYLAFLTMIAPLIALTYPLDKIKDRTSTSIYIVD